MEGHVRKKSGRWYVTLERSKDPDTGARRRSSMGGYATRSEAREALRAALEQARRGWSGPERITLAAYLREWLEGVAMEREATTAALYSTLLRHHVIPRIGGEKIERVTPAALTRLYAELLESGGHGGRPLSAKSVRNVHTTLRKALSDAVEARLLDWNPAEAAKVPKIESQPQPVVWSAENVTTFLRHIEDDRLAALYVVAASTGLRRGELCGLHWSDVSYDPPRLSVRRSRVQYGTTVVDKGPKTAKSARTLPLPAATVVALRRHQAKQAEEKMANRMDYTDADMIFADEIGRPLRPANVSKAFARHVRETGLPALSLHGLRHTWATLGLEAGVDTLYVSELLGHSSPAITMNVYQHVREDRLVHAMEQVGAAIFGG